MKIVIVFISHRKTDVQPYLHVNVEFHVRTWNSMCKCAVKYKMVLVTLALSTACIFYCKNWWAMLNTSGMWGSAARFSAHSLAVLTGLNENYQWSILYAVPSRRPISFCSCRLLFHMFLSIFTAVVILTGRWLWRQAKGSEGASWAPETRITYYPFRSITQDALSAKNIARTHPHAWCI